MTITEKTELRRQRYDNENADPEIRPERKCEKNLSGAKRKHCRGSNDARVLDGGWKGIFRETSIEKLKHVAEPIGLLLALMLYTCIGGMVFRELELPAEISRMTRLREALCSQRKHLVRTITNNANASNLDSLVNVKLRAYELAVQEATEAGLAVGLAGEIEEILKNRSVGDPNERWGISHSIFFASTVLTTIGYGNVVPITHWGKLFCILFALVGIPLTLTVIAGWGRLLAEAVSAIAAEITPNLPTSIASCMPTNMAGRRSLGAFAAVVSLFLYLACGAAMFMLFEKDWDFFDSFYFCFITMTTIGFGDLVPKKPEYALLCTLYFLLGLALTSTIIELVRRQYAQSWRRLQALSGPLAETLKRIGEHAGGDMSALHSDLRRVLTIVSMPRLKRSGVMGIDDSKNREWEEAVEAVLREITTVSPPTLKKPLMQIVIYESSV
ncbi:TWiK family of potassium channels protein 7 isoform X2 [Cephus cinctus]|uniref:TWiK family of potassium channels protein 7 isoform X2 n=1 Tax=Cephus cinctus TaxID=211228 RepID=A0AAJ7BWF5_CEPCN|nr:TWiK family of potassium channels protein 7 isoform X2 [Cephus cinctus]